MSDLCVTPHDGDRRALPGLRLCGSCRDRLTGHLAVLPGLYERLAGILATGGSTGQRVSGSAAEPLPINTAVADHREQIRHDLVWWCLYVAHERGLDGPANSAPHTTCAWLAPHLDWLAADQAGAQECLPVMRELAGRARALLDPDRRLATGERCRQTVDGERCDGTIRMIQGHDEAWSARCSVCGPQEAAAYLHDGIAGRWVTIERVRAYVLRAHGVTVTDARVRKWSQRGHIAQTIEHGRVWYELASVDKYLTERGKVAS
jgi:hypothetical protein